MSHLRVLIADKLESQAVDVFVAKGVQADVKTGLPAAELAAILPGYDALLVRSSTQVTEDVLNGATRLKVIGRAGIGVDNIDLNASARRGIKVMNAPGGNAVSAAEHALALLFAVTRNIPQAAAAMREGRWDKTKFKGHQISGKTLGVLGMGQIGRLVAERAVALGMQVLVFDPFVTPERAREIGAEKADLDGVLAAADYITCHTPLTPETRGLLGAAAFAKCKDGVYVINAARGGVVDEQALLEALNSGKVAGAALDVFVDEPPSSDHPLRSHERVVLTPHLGASTHEAQIAVAVQIAEQVADYLVNGTAVNVVNGV